MARRHPVVPTSHRAGGEKHGDEQRKSADGDLDFRREQTALTDVRIVEHEHDDATGDQARREAAEKIGHQLTRRLRSGEDVRDSPDPGRIKSGDHRHQQDGRVHHLVTRFA